MTFWYNAPKNDSKFAQLNCSDYEKTGFYAKFSEVKIQTDKDGHFTFYGQCLKASDVKKKDADPSWRLTDELVQFTVHSKAYKKRKQTDGKWFDVDAEQSRTEQAICSCILEGAFDVKGGTTYKGTVNLSLSENDKSIIINGVNLKGDKIGFDDVAELYSETLKLIPVDNAIALKDIAPPSTESSGGKQWGGSRGETEEERLDARFNWFVKSAGLENEIKSLSDLCQADSKLTKQQRELLDEALRYFVVFG
jgi:hypothetical protein